MSKIRKLRISKRFKVTPKDINDELWKGLGERVVFIKETFAKNKITIHPSEGLGMALEEARALAASEKLPGEPSKIQLYKIAHNAHVIWALADNLDLCIKAELDIKSHLAQITTGTTDYGVGGEGHEIFYKDFEFELFIAASLLKNNIDVSFFESANDPRGDLIVGPIILEIKHLNSKKKVFKLINKFNKELTKANSYGIFVLAIEDMFSLGEKEVFDNNEEFDLWLKFKRKEIEEFGLTTLQEMSKCPRILGAIQTQTLVKHIGNKSRLSRLSNSLIFDRKDVSTDIFEMVKRIAVVFNPNLQVCSPIETKKELLPQIEEED